MRLTLQLNAIDNMSKVVSSAANRSMRSLNTMAQTAQQRANRARGAMFESGVMAAGGVAALAYPVKMAANYEMLRIRMVALTQSQADGMKLYRQTIKLASETPLTLEQVAQATTRLIGFGRTAKDAIVDVKMLGDVVTLAGGDINAAMVAYGQAAGEGRVMTRDLTQFVNAGVPIFKMLGEVTGANGAELKKMAEQGQLSFALLEEAFRKSTSSGGQFADGMKKMSESATGGWVRMTDEFGRFADVFGSSVLPMLKSWNEALIPIISGTAEWFRNHQFLAKAVMISIGAFTAFASIGLILNGVIWVGSTAMAGYATVAGWAGWQTIFASNAMWTLRIMMWGVGFAASAAWKALLAMGTTISGVVTPAFATLNAVMLANPIGVIVVVIAALIAYIGIAVVKWKEFGASMMFLMGPIGWIVNAFMSMRLHWESITDAFSGGFMSGIKRLGTVLLDSVLYPLEQILALIEKFTGSDSIRAQRIALGRYRESNLFTQNESSHSPIMHPKYPGESYESFRNVWSGGGTKTSLPTSLAPVSNSNSGGTTSINYNPTITIGAGTSAEDRGSFASMLEQHKNDIARMVAESNRQNNRKQFGYA